MAANLQLVEIPGFRDALRKESDLRRKAWVYTHTEIAGVRVRLLTMRDMAVLEEMQNGFFAPWRFDDDAEFLGHCAQLVWWLSDAPKPDRNSRRVVQPFVALARARLIAGLAKQPKALADGVSEYLRMMFLDAPKGGGGGNAIVAAPAYIADSLAAAGLFVGLDEMLDMPLIRLWQLMRLATRRVYGTPITNDSDRIACDYLATLNPQRN
jgi:hypothetical protein